MDGESKIDLSTTMNENLTEEGKLVAALHEAYISGYDEPRAISYMELAEEFGYASIPETDMLADAFDLGCRHAQKDVDRFDQDELLEEMASWGAE